MSSAECSPDDAAMVDALDEVWSRIAELGAGLTEEEWKRPTEVPGWSVQDNLTHLTDIEAMILGRPAPDHAPPEGLAHVKNEPGTRNERFVDSRRGWSGYRRARGVRRGHRTRVAQLRSYSRRGLRRRFVDADGAGHRARLVAVPRVRLVGARAGHARARSNGPAGSAAARPRSRWRASPAPRGT